ncbi:FmdB family zinc ribbon protein [Nocardioides terrisoli]|uniref:FmdB family zinc ribbon protein n=1 Tax=Nocardioides terrisoli TaxID=3388267 RepID=UPI00287B8CD8|nr:FmdB family zinc ribbon protein [Nocardioides marmorisolisilvae]
MPTYQYSCKDCGHFFEAFQNFSDDSLTVCPECGGPLRKVFNAVGVVFKGSGFYRNDSRSKSSSSDAPSTNGNGSAKPPSTSSPSTDASPSPAASTSTSSASASSTKTSSD